MRRLSCLTFLCLLAATAGTGCAPEPTPAPAAAADTSESSRPAVRPSREPREARDARSVQMPGTSAVVSSPSPAPGTSSSAIVPTAFRGLWAATAQDCTDAGSESRLEIGPDVLRFHESRGRVLTAEVDGPRLSVALRIAGEGELRDARHAYALSANGDRLTDVSTGFARMRCGMSSPDAAR